MIVLAVLIKSTSSVLTKSGSTTPTLSTDTLSPVPDIDKLKLPSPLSVSVPLVTLRVSGVPLGLASSSSIVRVDPVSSRLSKAYT